MFLLDLIRLLYQLVECSYIIMYLAECLKAFCCCLINQDQKHPYPPPLNEDLYNNYFIKFAFSLCSGEENCMKQCPFSLM